MEKGRIEFNDPTFRENKTVADATIDRICEDEKLAVDGEVYNLSREVEDAFRTGVERGYNTAMNRECVWTLEEIDYRTGCGWAHQFISTFCPVCGGKVRYQNLMTSGEVKGEK